MAGHGTGTGGPTDIKNSPMVSQRKADLGLDKAGFRGNKGMVSSTQKNHHI